MPAATPPMFESALWSHMQRLANAADRNNATVTDCAVVPVSEAAQAKAPVIPMSDQVPLPPEGDLAAHAAALAAVRGAGYVAGIEWPVCCHRLAVLHFLHGGGNSLDAEIDAGRLDECVLSGGDLAQAVEYRRWAEQMDQIRRRRHGGDGMALLRCAACHHVYGTWAIP